jgi:hypothetical protein
LTNKLGFILEIRKEAGESPLEEIAGWYGDNRHAA